MFKKINKNETIISGNCIIDSNLTTEGNIIIFGKINGSVNVKGNVTIYETGVILGEVTADNVLLSGTVEGNIHCSNSLKLTSSAKLTGDAYVKKFSSEEGCLFGGKCIMEELEKLKSKNGVPDKNFDMTPPTKQQKSTIISELETTENK